MFDTPGPVIRMYGLLRANGVGRGGRAVAAKLVERVYSRQRYIVLARRLDGDAAAPAADDEVMEVREGTRDELLELTTTSPARRRALAYLATGHRCALGLVHGEVAAWCWWADATASAARGLVDEQMTFFDVELGQGEAWCFDNYLRSAFRGGGRSSRFLRGLERLLWRRGYRRLLGYVDRRNLPARWTYETGGWRAVRTVDATYLLSLVGMSEGRLVVRNNERRAPATFPYRPIGDGGRRRMPRRVPTGT